MHEDNKKSLQEGLELVKEAVRTDKMPWNDRRAKLLDGAAKIITPAQKAVEDFINSRNK